MVTPVIFRKFKRPLKGDNIIAMFPTLPGTSNPDTCESYMHVGQHSPAMVSLFYAETLPATESEYRHLRLELEGVGYDDLRVYVRYMPWFTTTRLHQLRKGRTA